jgi:uncharacterized protein (TIGR00369 family)
VSFLPPDADFERRVRTGFARQAFMASVGARLAAVEAGRVVVELPFRQDLTQQDGFLHAGVVAGVVDSACGYAALSLAPAGTDVLSVEFKVNLLKPAVGTLFRAVGTVIRPGRTLTVCTGEVEAHGDGKPAIIALMQATMMTITANRSRRERDS